MHLILTGATGMIGAGVLDVMLRTPEVTKISILSRRPVPLADAVKDPRVQVIDHQNFTSYPPEVLSQLQGAKGCVWALGISQTQVNKDEYVKITKDFALEAAKAFAELGTSPQDPFRFVYVSGEGATHTPGMFTSLFARVKGETEQLLASLSESTPNLLVTSTRPCAVDNTHHERARKYSPEPILAYKLARTFLLTPIKVAYSKMYSPTEMLGRTHMALAMGRWDERGEALAGDGAWRLGPKSWLLANWALQRLDKEVEKSS